MKDRTIPKNFEDKQRFYASLGLLSLKELDNQTFKNELEKEVTERVTKLLEELENDTSFDKAKLKKFEANYRAQFTSNIINDLRSKLEVTDEVSTKRPTIPQSFEGKHRFYASLGLLTLTDLDNEAFKKELENEVTERVSQLLEELEKDTSFDKARLKEFEANYRAQLTNDIIDDLRSKLEVNNEVSTKRPTIPQSFEGKNRFYASLGLLTLTDLDNEAFKKELENEVTERVSQLLEELEKDTSFDKARLKEFEANYRAQLTNDIIDDLRSTLKVNNEVSTKKPTIPQSFEAKHRFYVSLGLLSKKDLDNEAFKKELENEVTERVSQLREELENDTSFDKAKLEEFETNYRAQLTSNIINDLRSKLDITEEPKKVNRALIQDPQKSFAGLIVNLQRLVDETYGYFEEHYVLNDDEGGITSPAECSPGYKDIQSLIESLKLLRDNFNNADALKDIKPQELGFTISGVGEVLRLTINPYVIETEFGSYERAIDWMSPYLIVQLSFNEIDRLKSSQLDGLYESFMSHFHGVQCVCLSYTKSAGKRKYIDTDVIHTITNWFNNAGIEVLIHESKSQKDRDEAFERLTETDDDKTMMKYMGILRAFDVITTKLKLLLDLEIESLSLQGELLSHDMGRVPNSMGKDIDDLVNYMEQVMQQEMELIIRCFRSDLASESQVIQNKIERALRKIYVFENRDLVGKEDQPIDDWEATFTIKKEKIVEITNESASLLENAFQGISRRIQACWDGSYSEQAGNVEKATDIKRKLLLPALQTNSLINCEGAGDDAAAYLNDILQDAILDKEIIVPPVSEDGVKSLVVETVSQFEDEARSKAFTAFTFPKVVGNWLAGANPLTLFLKLIKMTTTIPMKIFGPVFAIGGIFVLFGMQNVIKNLMKSIGNGDPTGEATKAFIEPLEIVVFFFVFFIIVAAYTIYSDSIKKKNAELKKAADAAVIEHRKIVEQVEKQFMDQLLKGVKVTVPDFCRRLKVHLDFRTKEVDTINIRVRKSIEQQQVLVVSRKDAVNELSSKITTFDSSLKKGQSQFSKYVKEALLK